MKDITYWREKIDNADLLILDLLNKRAGYALNIGKIKRQKSMPIYCPDREKDVINNVTGNNKGPLSNEAIIRLYERIIDESRRLEREEAVKYYQTEDGYEQK
jgi:chorismate mutase-like protein